MSSLDEYEKAMRSYWLAHVTPQSVADALAGFSLQPQVGFDWIAEAIRSVPTGLSPFEWDGCEAFSREVWPPNRTTARDAWKDLSGAIGAVFEIILERQPELESGISDDESQRIEAAREALGGLWDIARTRGGMEPEPRKYRSTAAKELRIEQALVLSVIFRRAFGRDATIDNREITAGGPWPEFYRRMMALAFDAPITRRDEAVLDEARAQVLETRKRLRERFGEGEDDEGFLYFGLGPE